MATLVISAQLDEGVPAMPYQSFGERIPAAPKLRVGKPDRGDRAQVKAARRAARRRR